MRYLKTKFFARWARKTAVSDSLLKDDLNDNDKKLLRKLSETLLFFSMDDINKNINAGELIEIEEVISYEKRHKGNGA